MLGTFTNRVVLLFIILVFATLLIQQGGVRELGCIHMLFKPCFGMQSLAYSTLKLIMMTARKFEWIL